MASPPSAGEPLARALDETLALMMDDRITSIKAYFDEQREYNARTNERLDAIERDQAAKIEDLEEQLSEAFERIEELEQGAGGAAAVEELEGKMDDMAQMIEQDVDGIKDSMQGVIDAAVEAAVEQVRSETQVRDNMLVQQLEQDRRLEWLRQTFASIKFRVMGNVKATCFMFWKDSHMQRKQLVQLATRATRQWRGNYIATAFNQWATEVRAKTSLDVRSLQEKLSTLVIAVESAERGDARGDTKLRLEAVESALADESERASGLVHEFFQYQQRFEVDLAADRLQLQQSTRASLTSLRKELGEAVEQCEVRTKEQLVGCIVRCETITREMEALRSEKEEEADAVAEAEAAAKNVEGLERQLEAIQRKHNHVEKATRRDLGVMGERLDSVVGDCGTAAQELAEVREELAKTLRVARAAQYASSGPVATTSKIPTQQSATASPASSKPRAQTSPVSAGVDRGPSPGRGKGGGGRSGGGAKQRSPGRSSSRYTSGHTGTPGTRDALGLPPPLPGR
eukprot:COSAG05_NODE_1797_length_4070_cov_83.199698_1_plen_514_part_00